MTPAKLAYVLWIGVCVCVYIRGGEELVTGGEHGYNVQFSTSTEPQNRLYKML